MPVTGRRAAKPAAQRLELPLSLEELYHGCTKHVRLTRRRRDPITGQIVESARVLEIAILPGMKAGSSFTYEGEGDQLAAGRPPQDIAIVLSEKPHTRFRREGADLHANVLLPLVDALTAERISMQTLDGRNIDVPLEGVVYPGSRAVVRGEGMPQRSRWVGGAQRVLPGTQRRPAAYMTRPALPYRSPLRGNLIITFDVRFPTTKLTGEVRWRRGRRQGRSPHLTPTRLGQETPPPKHSPIPRRALAQFAPPSAASARGVATPSRRG